MKQYETLLVTSKKRKITLIEIKHNLSKIDTHTASTIVPCESFLLRDFHSVMIRSQYSLISFFTCCTIELLRILVNVLSRICFHQRHQKLAGDGLDVWIKLSNYMFFSSNVAWFPGRGTNSWYRFSEAMFRWPDCQDSSTDVFIFTNVRDMFEGKNYCFFIRRYCPYQPFLTRCLETPMNPSLQY